MDISSGGVSAGMMSRSSFTVSQRQELEHQALIFNYMLAGLPVPPHLLLSIHKSFQSISHGFFNHPTSNMGYFSYYGKKVDPEPGRCRRTDGKKWRCSKDAYPDSKYCERHMNRSRNRSRKPVESHTITQSASSMTSLTATPSCGGIGNGSFQDLPLHAFRNVQASSPGAGQSQYQRDTIPYAIPSKDYRYLQGLTKEVGEHSFFSQASAGNRNLGIDSALDSGWPLAPTRMSSFLPSKPYESSILQNEYPQHSFYSAEFASNEGANQECQLLRPFFNEWPKTRDNWSGLEDERSSQTLSSTTQLSISIPTTTEFAAANFQSPHGED